MRIASILMVLNFTYQLFGGLEVFIKKMYEGEYIDCEPIKVEIGLKNNGAERIKIGYYKSLTRNKAFYLMINGEEYRGPKRAHEGFTETIEIETFLEAKEEIREEIDLRVIGLKAGRYEIKAVVDFSEYGERYNNLKVESEPIELIIKKPIGVDEIAYKEAEKYMNEHYKSGYRKVDFCEIITGEGWGNEFRNILLEKYPTSTYAGWVVYERMQKPLSARAEKIKELMDKGLYMEHGWVPWPWEYHNGLKELNGREYVEWHIKWGEELLKNHPDFPFISEIKIILGLAYLKLNQIEKGLSMLKDISNENSKEGIWAKEYLGLIEKSKIKEKIILEKK